MISKPHSYLASKRSRHQRSDGDCALSLSTPVASRNGQVGHTARPHGSGSRRTSTGEPDPPSLRLTRLGTRRTASLRLAVLYRESRWAVRGRWESRNQVTKKPGAEIRLCWKPFQFFGRTTNAART